MQKPKLSSVNILNYVKSKSSQEIQLGNIIEKLDYYGLGIDYKLSKVLSVYIDVTANIDPRENTYISAQQATFNFIYKK
jgi:predicted porin